MKKNDNYILKKYVKELQGKRLEYIGRASSMLCFGFGKKYINNTYKKIQPFEVYEYRIHIECAWRIVNQERKLIIVASDDIYEPKEKNQIIEEFDWELRDNNLFDEKSKKWFESDENICVKNIYTNQFNDLIIDFSNKSSFQTFVNCSNDNECWRMFRSNIATDKKNPHYVVYGDKCTN